MAECFACEQDMLEADECDPDRTMTFVDGETAEPIPYGEDWADVEGRCHDCGVTVGSIHHPGCDVEECPRCGQQYFICDCQTVEKVELWNPEYRTDITAEEILEELASESDSRGEPDE